MEYRGKKVVKMYGVIKAGRGTVALVFEDGTTQSMSTEKLANDKHRSFEVIEMCPECGCEVSIKNYDTDVQGFETTCPECGKKMMLCDECLHCEDNPDGRCDWHEETGCWRKRKAA